MKRASALRQLGDTQQKLLRRLLLSPQGVTVEDLCKTLGVTHNAVRQHLAALMARGFIARGQSLPSGGRPRACFVLLPAGRELFPRNYALIAERMLEYLYAHAGTQAVQVMLADMGTRLGEDAAMRIATAADPEAATKLLAEQLDSLGYEAEVVEADGHTEVAAFNCVFHQLARAHPDVCRFDLAFMSAATGRPVQRTQCMLHGAPACRFRIGNGPAKTGAA
ncbi:MAG: HTH domain-containing protein [Rhodanobacteraceae bacterium]|nr:MAG: HTH domain-containing protein [Rhodanobacteraceae bacterium]